MHFRYRFLRLPLGISCAPEVFEEMFSEIFDPLPRARVYIDDILVWGSSNQEHDERLKAALCAAQQDLPLNFENAHSGVQKIAFVGDFISETGIRPSPQLVGCLHKFPAAKNKLAVERMLSVISYFGKYLSTLADRTKLLRRLIRKDSVRMDRKPRSRMGYDL